MTDVPMQVESSTKDHPPTANQYRLRLWPAVLTITAMWLARVWASVGEMAPSKFFFGLVIAPAVATLLLNFWWLIFSRLRIADRLLIPFAFGAVASATVIISGKNFPAMGLILYALPVVSTIWVVWLVLSMKFSWPLRRVVLIFAFLGTGAWFSMLRVDGMDGSFAAKFNWRWTPTPEDKLLSELKTQTKSPEATKSEVGVPALTAQAGDWTGFRGPHRDGRLTGVHIRTDWDKQPPKQLWRHRVGPGWSSCTVIGDRLFTQEQRGEDEFVVCYDSNTGSEIWSHRDPTRFEEVIAGPGPRGTPTFHEGRIYSLGANGSLNCLDAATGKQYWNSDIVKDSEAKVPQWGFSGSPLVCHGVVSIFAGGPESKGVVAYRADNGELAWAAGDGSHSYCSTQAATFHGVEQVLVCSDAGLTSYEPEKGGVLWKYEWPVEQARVVQPTVVNETDVLLGTGMSGGTKRLSIQHEGDAWSVKESWTTKAIKPYYNDLVVLNDHLYGFDNNVFMCVSLSDGKMQWRARGYGNGQVLLLVDDALLLILTETGDLALVEAKPGEHKEIARIKAIEGKTWNHPVIANGKIFVRNAEEMACLELPIIAE